MLTEKLRRLETSLLNMDKEKRSMKNLIHESGHESDNLRLQIEALRQQVEELTETNRKLEIYYKNEVDKILYEKTVKEQ